MNSKDIYQNIEFLHVYNKIDCDINKIRIDTRIIKENDVYVGIKGDRQDGNLLFMDAFNNGAVIAILEYCEITDELIDYLNKNNKSIVLVQDTVLTLGKLATMIRNDFDKPVIAITGSAGKTTTKDMIYSVLKEKYNAHKTIGNQNNHLGLPLTIFELGQKKEMLVLELGMNHFGEISYLTHIAKPTVAVITNVGTAHIGNLGSRKNILKAKLEILEGMDKDGVLFINNDNDLLHEWYLKNKENYNIKTFGITNDSDYKATNIVLEEFSGQFTVNNDLINIPVGGEVFVYNSLAAYAIGKYFGLSKDEIQKGISNFESSRNRMNIINVKDITIVDDCYNANYDSVKYAIKYLGAMQGRRIAVLGTMLELGEFSNELHTNLGDVIYKQGIDILITVGKYADLINKRAIELGFDENNSYHFDNKEDAINKIKELMQANDNILVKASLSMNFKEIVDKIVVEE